VARSLVGGSVEERQFLDFSKHTLVTTRSDLAVRFEDVKAAAQRIRGVVTRTPVVHSDRLDALAGNALFLKCENLQRVGAFKIRGAYNRLSLLSPEERARGVVAFSSGNHAQGVALAASLLDIKATIVMPDDAPAIKLAMTRELGAAVITYRRADEDREAIAAAVCERTGGTLVPPFDDPRIIAGQGTCVLELCEQVPGLDAIVTPLGGGGLLSGCALVANAVAPQAKIYGVEPDAGDDWRQSLARRERVRIPLPDTIADGLQATTPGVVTWPIVSALVSEVVTVSDAEIRRAMRLLFELCRLIVEPSGAVAVAAALNGRIRARGAKMGLVISGGNVDPRTYCKLVGQVSA
jgi:threonine dehydratase